METRLTIPYTGKSIPADWLAALMIIVVVVVLQIPHLNVPFYWDEAWSYGPAVWKMAASGPTLLPGSLPADVTRGHPLLFYLLGSAWLTVFPKTVLWAHLFSLSISITFLIELFAFTRRFFGAGTAVATLLLFSVQALFLSHASKLLPEILLALLSLAAIHCYFSGKQWLTSVFITLALMCKETALALVVSFVLFEAVRQFRHWTGIGRFTAVMLRYFTLPVLITGSFFLWQYRSYGWFLFPEHVGMMKQSVAAIFDTITGYGAYLFLYLGHNALTVAFLVSLLRVLFKQRIDHERKLISGFFLLFTFLYIGILGLNFYSIRYLLSILPLFILMAVFFLFSALKKRHFIGWAGLLILVAYTLFLDYTPNSKGNAVAYLDEINVQQKAVHYLEDAGLQHVPVAAHFLMRVCLTDTVPGYLSQGLPFTNVTAVADSTTVLVVLGSQEEDPVLRQAVNGNRFQLAARYESRKAWCEIWQIKNPAE